MGYDEQAMAAHREWRGKIDYASKVTVSNHEDLSVVYTPGVAAPCLAIEKDPSLVRVLTGVGNLVAVITDGSAVLGLGNIGPQAALPVMEGKCVLFKAFAGVDAALMAHPAPSDVLRPSVSALQQLSVTFGGRNAHAAGAPWEGRNALDAMVIAYSAIAALRQQLPPDALVHGVITHGGEKPNIIPDRTTAEFVVRSRGARQLGRLKQRVLACLQAGADASGCGLEVKEGEHVYLDMQHNEPMVEAYAAHLTALGAPAVDDPRGFNAFSTDMGNVSYVVPSIHPVYGIPAEAGNHTSLFSDAAGADEAHAATLVVAKALALTALDLISDPELLGRAKASFTAQMAEVG